MHTLIDYKAKCALSGLVFQFYNNDEITKLSVKEINNPQSLDRLLNPIPNGLYDLALGPLDKNDICMTCGLDFFCCPGHFGHINLVLPVYNPITFKELIKLLRMSCTSCYHFLTTKLEKDYFYALMTITNYGLTDKLHLVRDLYAKLIRETDEKVLDKISFRKQFEDLILEILSDPEKDYAFNSCVKNVVREKLEILKEFCDVKLKTHKKTCPNCAMPLRQLRAEHNSKLFYSRGVSKRQMKQVKSTRVVIDIKEDEDDQEPTEPDIELDDDETKKQDDIDDLNKSTEKLKINNHLTDDEKLETLSGQSYITPIEARKIVQKIIENEKETIELMFGLNNSAEKTDRDLLSIFFFDRIAVAPSKFRPISQYKDQKFENSQTLQLSKLIQENLILKDLLSELTEKNTKKDEIKSKSGDKTDKKAAGQRAQEKLQNSWVLAQTIVNTIYDADLDKLNTDTPQGLKQLLERKEGLFRKHMMGKRVNYAGRSVISPDLYIGTDELGVPEVFAKKLTYPQPVNSVNFFEMKQLVLNGPDIYPGASFVQYGNGTMIKLKGKDYESRAAIAKQLLAPDSSIDSNLDIKIVHRHLKNGDILLFNRQPTLHRPSIMAHKARVLPNEKTLRLHYSNCKSYNADFDGDEMNAHLPQNEVARAEAYNLIASSEHYLVPKDGTPLGGLIHDHIIAGVTLTIRGRYFTRDDYQALVYNTFGNVRGRMKYLPPAILKPRQLWTGKQVISTLLINLLPENKPCLNLEGKAKISEKTWYREHEAARPNWSSKRKFKDNESHIEYMSESNVIIRNGHLLCGVLDKSQYGSSSYSLVHACYELYGGSIASKLLTCFGKLFTAFLQHRGFTLGVEDILLTPHVTKPMKKIMKTSKKCGNEALAHVFTSKTVDDVEGLKEEYQRAHLNPDEAFMKEVDLAYKGKVDSIQNSLVNLCFPGGLMKKFPYNNLQLMIQSGAKGSTVNSMQMSCLLGQQELEGRRPRLMPNGNTLPSFLPYESSPTSGGFILSSFMTGLTPQEYFFHCMAGREGLVDTAVKTSRSGYLQRCLVKHLEGIVVNYDLTVRDSDGSVIQFQYGEDSLSIEKTQYLNQKQFPFLIDNYSIITANEDEMKKIRTICHYDLVDKALKKVKEWKNEQKSISSDARWSPFLNFSRVLAAEPNVKQMKFLDRIKFIRDEWAKLNDSQRKIFKKGKFKRRLPVTAEFNPDRFLGAISENLQDIIDNYIEKNVNRFADSPNYSGRTSLSYTLDTKEFKELIHLKSLKSCITPGDCVGVIAAQSIGEPSTQMTLNTFHFAGRGDMNVTLGIPRLREILMVATANIKTPSMAIPIYAEHEDKADKLKSLFSRTQLWDCIHQVKITQTLKVDSIESRDRTWQTKIRFEFLPQTELKVKTSNSLKLYEIMSYMELKFFKNLCISINKKYNQISSSSLLHASTVRDKSMKNFRNINSNFGGGGDDDDLNDAVDQDDLDDLRDSGDSSGAKLLDKVNDELEYVGEEEEKNEVGENEEDESDDEKDVTMEDKENENDDESKEEENDESQQQDNQASMKSLKKKTKKVDILRVNNVMNISNMIESYCYDSENKEWCEITLKLDALKPRLDLYSIIQKEAKHSYIARVEHIKRCFINRSTLPEDNNCMKMITEGINIAAVIKYSDLLDISKLYMNDIHKMASTFGIEAAVKVIIKEIKQVFNAYGINVDYRHLSLIADYMTFEGVYKPFNRIGIKTNPSPLQKMSFETCLGFFKDACLTGQKEKLNSPSARLVTGRMVSLGTGLCDVVTKLV